MSIQFHDEQEGRHANKKTTYSSVFNPGRGNPSAFLFFNLFSIRFFSEKGIQDGVKKKGGIYSRFTS